MPDPTNPWLSGFYWFKKILHVDPAVYAIWLSLLTYWKILPFKPGEGPSGGPLQ